VVASPACARHDFERLLGSLRCKRESESVFDAAAAARKSARFGSLAPFTLASPPRRFPNGDTSSRARQCWITCSSHWRKARSRAEIACPFNGRKRNRARLRFVGSFSGILLDPPMIALLDNAILPVRLSRTAVQLTRPQTRDTRAIFSDRVDLSRLTSIDRSHLPRSSRCAICGSEETLEKPPL